MFKKHRMKEEIRELRFENIELLCSKLALLTAIESMYKDGLITRQQVTDCYVRYLDKFERLKKGGA